MGCPLAVVSWVPRRCRWVRANILRLVPLLQRRPDMVFGAALDMC